MKTLFSAFAIAALALIGTCPKAEAHGFVSGYVQIGGGVPCDVPSYTERYLIGYDAWGNPVWGYRTVYAAPRYVVPVCPPRVCVPPVLPVPYPYHRHHGDHRNPYYR